jgi:hypothetical protein
VLVVLSAVVYSVTAGDFGTADCRCVGLSWALVCDASPLIEHARFLQMHAGLRKKTGIRLTPLWTASFYPPSPSLRPATLVHSRMQINASTWTKAGAMLSSSRLTPLA